MNDSYDIAVIGAGAAGLMAAIAAGRTANAARTSNSAPTSIILLDGAPTLGAKILVAGGGRCNVTHHTVDETAYAGSSRNAIKKVLRAFTVEQTVAFFEALGVQLKREETGKLFPTTDKARTVLYALLDAAKAAGVHLLNPWRVDSISRDDSGTFTITRATALDAPAAGPSTSTTLRARAIILATGGLSLPKSGSDGHGHTIARSLGHTITDRVFPSLVPLVIDGGFFTRELMGLAIPATLTVVSGTGKHLVSFTNSTLLTHFGLSGPGPLDISRYYTDAKRSDPAARLLMNFLPAFTTETLDAHLQKYTQPINRFLNQRPQALPDRLARALAQHAGVDPAERPDQLPRDLRRALATTITALPMPITGDRGYTYAEVTAGGVPLSELHLATMQSRFCPGLYLVGEVLDVDGRIGGFNFQWAWSSGHVAGESAARALATPTPAP